MTKEKDYPLFSELMRSYLGDNSDFTGQAAEWKACAGADERKALCGEIQSLMKQDVCDLQAFMKRNFGHRLRQNEIIPILSSVLDILQKKE